MIQSWRWYGPNDPVSLADIRQAGATDVVTALHHIPNGKIWSLPEIQKRQAAVSAAGLKWSVVESVPVHEHIKQGLPDRDALIEAYGQTLLNLGKAGIHTVCYNFMPVLDWTRTDLTWALRFDLAALAAFDLFILERDHAEQDYPLAIQQQARGFNDGAGPEAKAQLTRNIIAGLPGAEEGYSVEDFREALSNYAHIGEAELRENLRYFIAGVIPFAEKAGVRMAIHPDDPPFPLFGLPRVVSTEADFARIVSEVKSPNNGITFCTGSLGVNQAKKLPGMIERLGEHIHFFHLRNVAPDQDGGFYEADHLEGAVDMYEVVRQIYQLEQKSGRPRPMRPDHGHLMLDDLHKTTNSGYSAIGRLRGLAELRGLEMGISRTLGTTPS